MPGSVLMLEETDGRVRAAYEVRDQTRHVTKQGHTYVVMPWDGAALETQTVQSGVRESLSAARLPRQASQKM